MTLFDLQFNREFELLRSVRSISAQGLYSLCSLFQNKANCIACHVGFNLTTYNYHNLGVGFDKPNPDLGRYEITKLEEDKGRFKTPTLREVTYTGPYMHDGRHQTLEEVIEFYNMGGIKNPNSIKK